MLKISSDWKDYECLSAGNGEKLERWGNFILRRPEPLAKWGANQKNWQFDAYYCKNSEKWVFKSKLPDFWVINYKNLFFKIKLTNFKHTGLFPEQAVNWDFMMEKVVNSQRKIKVLNLFAYTGGATMACSKAGADVVHVDSSKGMVEWAKENMALNNLGNNNVRFIVDDCLKFVEKEYRRGNKYDAIIMDPPSYGRGPNKEIWKFDQNINNLISNCVKILSNEPLFFLINSYTTGVNAVDLKKILSIYFKYGYINYGEVGLPIKENNMILPCGIYCRWESK